MAENFTGTTPINAPIPVQQDKIQHTVDPIGPNPETVELLDKWFDEQVAKAKTDEEAAAAAAADDKAPDPGSQVAKPDDKAPDPGSQVAKPDDKAPDPAPAAPAAPDPFSDIDLPANARGKSAEAFAAVKERAAVEIKKAQEERDALKKQYEEAQAKLANPVPEELTKELETLRQFRNRLDIEADPNFHRSFDAKVSTLEDFIYHQLKSTGKFGDAGLAKIKEIGLDNLDWDDLFTKVNDPPVQRMVQARRDEIAVTRFEKAKALEAAKANIDTYVKHQREQHEQAAKAHTTATQKELDQLLPKLEWLGAEDKPLPATATPAEREVWEDTRKFKLETKECIKEALTDDSPSMRAILVAGMAQLLKLRRDHAVVVEDQKRTASALKEAQEKLDKIKKASVSNQSSRSAPASDSLPKPKVDYTMSAGEAMDAHARQAGLLK